MKSASLIALLLIGLQVHGLCGVELRLYGLIDPVFGDGECVQAPDYDGYKGQTNTLAICYGDPVGIMVTLRNNSASESEIFHDIGFGRLINGHLILTYPDGSHHEQWLVHEPKPSYVFRPRSMLPQEYHYGYYILYDRLAYAPGGYVFPSPGQYYMRLILFTQRKLKIAFENETNSTKFRVWDVDDANKTPLSIEELAQQQGILLSNPIEINVGPPFPGWAELSAGGLLDALMGYITFEEFCVQIGAKRLEELVAKSGRPWLKHWYSERQPDESDSSEQPRWLAAVYTALLLFAGAISVCLILYFRRHRVS